MAKKILMIVAPVNYRDEELEIPKAHFEKSGFNVVIASTKKGTCNGMLGGSTEASISLNEINVDDYDGIVFVGGSGTPLIRKEERALEIAREGVAKGKVVGAICWAPTTLAKAGVLKGKKATVWFGPDNEFGVRTDKVIEKFGGMYVSQPVVTDGKIITADGPRSAKKFAEEIVKLLGS